MIINQALVVIYSHFAGIKLIYHLRASEFKLTWITSNYCIIHIVNMYNLLQHIACSSAVSPTCIYENVLLNSAINACVSVPADNYRVPAKARDGYWIHSANPWADIYLRV